LKLGDLPKDPGARLQVARRGGRLEAFGRSSELGKADRSRGAFHAVGEFGEPVQIAALKRLFHFGDTLLLDLEIVESDLAEFGAEVVGIGGGTCRRYGGDQVVEGVDQPGGIHGFGQVGAASRVTAPIAIGFCGVSGKGDDGRREAELPQTSGGRESVHDGHLHVHEDGIKLSGGGNLDAESPVLGVGQLDAGLGEGQTDEAAVDRAVFDKENVHLRRLWGPEGIRSTRIRQADAWGCPVKR